MRRLLLTVGLLGFVGSAIMGTGPALAQSPGPDTVKAEPRFEYLPRTPGSFTPQTGNLPTWLESWTYNSVAYSATMVGSFPGGGASTTVPVYIIPVLMKFGTKSFSPSTVQSNRKSAQTNLLNSPLFNNLTFTEAGTNLGTTQYIDAYQRGNFWGTAASHAGWHTLLGKPTVLTRQTMNVPTADGSVGVAFGVTVGLADINYVNGQLQGYLAKFPQITASDVVIFEMYNTYLTQSGGCCIGGFHTAYGAQTYMQFTYIGKPGAFSQDVSALSHELGEWADDPFANNNSPCGALEVGDPLEGGANYGDYPYALGGFTYHLQDLVFMPYFGAPPTTSLASRSTFQGTSVSVCQNGA